MPIFTGPRPYALRNIRGGHADVHAAGLGDTKLLGYAVRDGLHGNPWAAIPSGLITERIDVHTYLTRHEAAMDLVERFS